LDIKQDKN